MELKKSYCSQKLSDEQLWKMKMDIFMELNSLEDSKELNSSNLKDDFEALDHFQILKRLKFHINNEFYNLKEMKRENIDFEFSIFSSKSEILLSTKLSSESIKGSTTYEYPIRKINGHYYIHKLIFVEKIKYKIFLFANMLKYISFKL